MKVFLSLRYPDLKETAVGRASIRKTLGWNEGSKALAFATRRHLAAVRRGEGLYPEGGKRRVWLKLHYLKLVYECLRLSDETTATERFESIAKGPTLQFIDQLDTLPEAGDYRRLSPLEKFGFSLAMKLGLM